VIQILYLQTRYLYIGGRVSRYPNTPLLFNVNLRNVGYKSGIPIDGTNFSGDFKGEINSDNFELDLRGNTVGATAYFLIYDHGNPMLESQTNVGVKVDCSLEGESVIQFDTVIEFDENAIFREAVNKATAAAEAAQSVQLPEEWTAVSNLWYQAINLMKTVPESSQNYQVAQRKASEYQKNLDYSQQNSGQ
jgi:hypothetical protein